MKASTTKIPDRRACGARAKLVLALAWVGGLALLFGATSSVRAQWDPSAGSYGKEQPDDLRVLTWNLRDGLCSSNEKSDAPFSNWDALARILAALRPDVALLQECGDNTGNGTGFGVDGVAALELTARLFVEGGPDPFQGGAPVTSWVRKYAPDYDLPYVFASASTDGFNRNVILSRHPFADLNGDGSALSSNFLQLADLYSPGGNGGIRGYQLAEIDLPDARYRGDLLLGNSHLKAGSTAADRAQRLAAAQNIAYHIDAQFNGLGTSFADPQDKIFAPAAELLPDPFTFVVTGGDLNEDELAHAERGPAAWIAEAAGGSDDGTDRDRSDMTYDDARLVFSGGRATFVSGAKLDYLCWQDSLAALRRSFLFDSADLLAGGGPAALPPELSGLLLPETASAAASDHRPVVIDLVLPLVPGACRSLATDLGGGKAGTGGLVPRFELCGGAVEGRAAELRLTQALPGAEAFLVLSLVAAESPWKGGVLVPAPDAILGPVAVGADGALLIPIPALRADGGRGEFFAQWILRDPGASWDLALSNALRVRVPREPSSAHWDS